MLKEKTNKTLSIVLAEPSEMLREGLCSLLNKTHLRYNLTILNELEELPQHHSRKNYALVIINPILIVNQIREFLNIKEEYHEVGWIALQYTYFDPYIMELFNEVITLHDTPEKIANKLKKIYEETENRLLPEHALSHRETEVLLHLASGRSNKEIADILCISVNTVITHRKNISQKTGIKTVSGLTIYALSQGLIKP